MLSELSGDNAIRGHSSNGNVSCSVIFVASAVLLCPRIVYTDLNGLWLLGAFGECQMMAPLAATTWLVSPVMHQDVVWPRGMRPCPRMAGDGTGPRLVVVGG